MHEFVVTLRNGTRFTVKADRVVLDDPQYVALVHDRRPTIGDPNPLAGAVALFVRGEVAAVVSRDHLVGEEKVDPISPHYVGGDPNSDIPF